MKLTLESTRIAFYVGYILIAGIALTWLYYDLPVISFILLIPFVALNLFGSYIVAISFKQGAIKMHWKGMETDLIIPFPESDSHIYAYDEDENCYIIGFLLIPERLN